MGGRECLKELIIIIFYNSKKYKLCSNDPNNKDKKIIVTKQLKNQYNP